ncbi:unnamed protein product [Leptosia nina]|uniref:Uncharacterized protein n=1 Tax=Leptosia nina TaxID=320188 RepID=A0AAV1J2Y8_9NEOP
MGHMAFSHSNVNSAWAKEQLGKGCRLIREQCLRESGAAPGTCLVQLRGNLSTPSPLRHAAALSLTGKLRNKLKL